MRSGALRRLGLVTVALAISAFILRGQLSSALVWRGDALAYWGDGDGARGAYRRALFFDAANGVAADRLVFADAISHRPSALQDGVADATRYLRADSTDLSVRFDRALCYQKLGDIAFAADDFEIVGTRGTDVRALMFAAIDRKRLGEHSRSNQLLRLALAKDPSFMPARRALRVAMQP